MTPHERSCFVRNLKQKFIQFELNIKVLLKPFSKTCLTCTLCTRLFVFYFGQNILLALETLRLYQDILTITKTKILSIHSRASHTLPLVLLPKKFNPFQPKEFTFIFNQLAIMKVDFPILFTFKSPHTC